MSLIQIDGIGRTVRSGGRGVSMDIIRDVHLRVESGERVAVVGRSGSGKTTLLSVLGLLDRATTGRYLLEGQDVGSMRDARRARVRGSTMGFVFQRFCLLQHLTAAENVHVATVHARMPRRLRAEAVARSMDDVDLTGKGDRRPHELSGGEQQRVAIARAIVTSPRVLLADEPTAALDSVTGAKVMTLLHRLSAVRGVTLIVVTHDPVVAAGCHRQLTMRSGELVA